MKLRSIILLISLFAFLSVVTGGLLYYYSFRNAAFEKTEADAYSRLNLVSDQLSFYLSEHIKPVKALSRISEIKEVFHKKDRGTIMEANRILDNFTHSLNLEVSYLLTADGTTICSSNRNADDSFVGENFAFRPYFKKALKGEPATYLALGSTSKKRGVYHSNPVYSRSGDTIVGVAVIKASVEFVESKLFPPSDNILFFVNPEGVIFISNQESFRFKLLWDLSKERISDIVKSRQFGRGPWIWAGFSKDKSGYVTDIQDEKYLYTKLYVKNYPGWAIVNLRHYRKIDKLVSDPFVKIIGPVVTSVLILSCLIVFILYKQGIKEIIRRKKAENELRVSEERYRTNLEQQVKKRTIQLEKAKESLKDLSRNIIASQEREKANTARELHDHLGQVLTALRIDAVWTRQRMADIDDKAVSRAERMCSLIDETIKDVKDMAYRLRPRVLDDLGLSDALESLVNDFEKRSNVSCVFQFDKIPRIDNNVETALYRIGQEAVTNAIKHSGATAVTVELLNDNNSVTLYIKDNGCGFDNSENKKVGSFGLEGMRERAMLIGGELDINSQPMKGTTICCRIKG